MFEFLSGFLYMIASWFGLVEPEMTHEPTPTVIKESMNDNQSVEGDLYKSFDLEFTLADENPTTTQPSVTIMPLPSVGLYLETITEGLADENGQIDLKNVPSVEEIYASVVPHIERLRALEIERIKLTCQLDAPDDWKETGRLNVALHQKHNISLKFSSDYIQMLMDQKEDYAIEIEVLRQTEQQYCKGTNYEMIWSRYQHE